MKRMILLLAVAAGVAAGFVRAWISQKPYNPPVLRHVWLIVMAVIPQMFAFFIPITRDSIPDFLAAVSLVISQGLLLFWVGLNIKTPVLWIAGVGLIFNLLVIFTNGGFMPVSPETVLKLWPGTAPEAIQTGARLGNTKDIVLNPDGTNLPFLSDNFVSPAIFSSRYAFSLGDLLLAIGIFGMLGFVDGNIYSTNSFIRHS